MKKLATTVYVNGEAYPAGATEKQLGDIAKRITNPAAWEDGADDSVVDLEPPSGPVRPAESASKAKWASYAEDLGVEHADDATKADIIVAVDAHEAQA